MIKLTGTDGRAIYFNPQFICTVSNRPKANCNVFCLGDEYPCIVTEKAEDIIKMIEYEVEV